MKKVLIAYYSRTGFTRQIAEYLGATFNADVEEIRERKSRNGVLGYLRAAFDTVFGREADISDNQYQPENYDVVIIGTPVWAARPVPAIQAYMKKNAANLDVTALFCTLGGSDSEKTFAKLEEMLGHSACACLALTDDQIKNGIFKIPLREFIERVKAATPVADA